MKNSPDKNSFDREPRARGGLDDAARESFGEDELESVAPGDSFAFAASESELKSLLESWRVPAAPQSLRARVAASYRQRIVCREEEVMNSMTSAAGVADFRAFAHAEYRPTILEDERLLSRLAARVREVARESELTWPELRRDPAGFTRRLVAGYALLAARALGRENVGYGLAAAFAVLLTLALGVVAAGGFGARRGGLLAVNVRDDLEFVGLVEDSPKSQPTPEQGAPGFAKGAGGGMKPKFERAGGGGGGGRQEDKPAVGGKLPQASLAPQVLAPDPRPPVIRNPQLPTAATIQADPTLFPTDARMINYGDPKSKATELSSGSGTGNGIGEGTGGGVGSGNGTGYGPGEGFNTGGGPAHGGGGGPGGGGIDYHKIFNTREVSRRAQVISRPEPLYTEEARRNQITGTVTLRLVLNANGAVTNITAISRLPDGLTERAIEAARQIKFSPAEKDGRKVSQYATIQYNFNIY
jgi:TonB family protein